MLYRNIFTGGIFLSFLFLPWWLTGLLVLFGFVSFSFYLEGSLAVFFFDLIYLPPVEGFFTAQFFLTLSSLVILLILEYGKKSLIIYNT